ncbi:hypothetical protein [uncultured Roseovarius sp.]|uniref:hypothetical protein n=1 Tax=uncultured Roseovarius sp. TaxID=293344 RepID=UPI00261BCDD9|nr:hypothetical protein [uncultured Roseovarius sp.]
MTVQDTKITAHADPAYAMYQEWRDALKEWLQRSDTDDWEASHMVELEERYMSIENAVSEKTPESIPQAALVAMIVWNNERPDERKGTPEYEAELEQPYMQPLLRLREWAESVLTA